MPIDQMACQFNQLGVNGVNGCFLLDNFSDAIVKPGSCLPDSLDGLQATPKIAAALSQLRVQLRRSRFVPQLNLTECRFIDHPQPRCQRPNQAF